MTISAAGAPPVRDSDANLVVRIEESWYSKQFAAANTPARQILRGPYTNTQAGGTLPSILGDNAIPAGATFVVVAGRAVLAMVSAAGVNSRFNNAAEVAAIPVSQQFQAAGALNGVLLNRPPRQYTFNVPVRQTVAGTARLELGVVTSTNFLTFAGTPPGAIFSCDPAVNGGNYVLRYRQVAAGAITDVNTAVAPTDWHLLGFRYTEGATPRLEWLLDGVPVRVVEGDANMPVFPGGVNHPGFCPGYGLSAPAGTTYQFGPASYEIRNLA